MLEERPQPEVERVLTPEVEEGVLASAHSAREDAQELRKQSRECRAAAARARWCSRKQHLRARRLRVRSDELRTPQLDEFVEIASVDDLVEVLVLLVQSSEQDGPADDRGLSA